MVRHLAAVAGADKGLCVLSCQCLSKPRQSAQASQYAVLVQNVPDPAAVDDANQSCDLPPT